MIAFLDASAVIDAVEETAAWAEALKQLLRQLALSRQSWLGWRVGSSRRRDA